MKTLLKKTIATGFFTGYLPAGGTAGTLVGLVVFLLLRPVPVLLIAATFILIPCGILLSTWAEEYFRQKDSGKIVIDEIAGYLIAMLGISLPEPVLSYPSWLILVLSFVLFRFFDIVKPLYIKKVQELPGGTGIMLDDIMAGIYANLALRAIIFFLPA